MELLYYFLKVSACTILFFAFYLLVLRKLTFFKINRFYLLVTLMISFIIPTLHFTLEREIAQSEEINVPLTNQSSDIASPAFQAPLNLEPTTVLEESFNYYLLLPYLYLSIVATLLIFAIWRLFQLVKHTKSSIEKINGLKIVTKTKGFTNCSFFNYVFIDEGSLTQEELSILLKHEEVHAKQFHSIDKILMMVLKAILWFNPVVYLYDRALEEAHEYEADETTSQSFGTSEYAGLLLRLAVSRSEMPLVHNFVKSPIKERIKMLFNSKSKHMKKLMYLLTLPIGLGLIWGFTVDVVDVLPSAKNEEKEFTLILDAGHGGKDQGIKVNGYAEKDITLAMAKKIKEIAEAKGIRVVTTRDDDAQVSLKDRAQAEGTVLVSLHVNAEAAHLGGKRNGVEMFTSGSYDKDMKLAKSNSLTYHLYKSLKNTTGIKVNNKPEKRNLVVLNNSTSPGVVLEMGYLTNKSDFNYITNSIKQDELAKLIVDGIISYKQYLPSDEKMAELQKDADEFSIKYKDWKNSEKYAWLISEAKNFKAQTLLGKIQSLNYVTIGGQSTLDGFILNVNNKLYRIYIDKEQLKSISFKVGDGVSLYAPKAEVWFDSEYPAIKPQKLTILPSVGIANSKLDTKPKLISSSKMNVDNINSITYIKNGVMEIGDVKLEAEDIIWDQKNEMILAKYGAITTKDGTKIASKSIVYDLKKGTFKATAATGNVVPKSSNASPYVVNKSPEVETPIISSAYILLSKLKTLNDSLKVRTVMDKTLLVSGKVKLNVDGYALTGRVLRVDKDSNFITAYMATFTDKNGSKISGDVIEFDLISKNYKIVETLGSAYKQN